MVEYFPSLEISGLRLPLLPPQRHAHSSSSSHDRCEPQPQPKKYQRMAVHSHGEQVLHVDAMSSDSCPVLILGARDYTIHNSS